MVDLTNDLVASCCASVDVEPGDDYVIVSYISTKEALIQTSYICGDEFNNSALWSCISFDEGYKEVLFLLIFSYYYSIAYRVISDIILTCNSAKIISQINMLCCLAISMHKQHQWP